MRKRIQSLNEQLQNQGRRELNNLSRTWNGYDTRIDQQVCFSYTMNAANLPISLSYCVNNASDK